MTTEQEVADVIARAPRAEEIRSRDVFDPELLLQGLATALGRREEQLQERIQTQQQELQRAVARYERVRTEGLPAISHYDLTIAHSGDPVAAIRESLRLGEAHVSYDRTALLLLLLELANTRAAIDAERRQMPLF